MPRCPATCAAAAPIPASVPQSRTRRTRCPRKELNMNQMVDLRIEAEALADSLAASLASGNPVAVTRRQFLKATGMVGGGLMLAIGVGERGLLGGRLALAEEGAAAPAKVYPPAAFIRIG